LNGPLLTLKVHDAMRSALQRGELKLNCSLDLDRSSEWITLEAKTWQRAAQSYPYLARCKDRTIYHWTNSGFEPAARFSGALIKLVPTAWGAPTFEIDGIKMLPSAKESPFADAERKVALIQPRGKVILDTCGGLGYFAAWCLAGAAQQIISVEKNADVLWLRSLNPWSPGADASLQLINGDITAHIQTLHDQSIDAALHDPPRFGIAGELYSQAFYAQLARVLKPAAKLFHYTGKPNQLTSGRDVPNEVATRLRAAGFRTALELDGVMAVKR